MNGASLNSVCPVRNSFIDAAPCKGIPTETMRRGRCWLTVADSEASKGVQSTFHSFVESASLSMVMVRVKADQKRVMVGRRPNCVGPRARREPA